MIALRPAARRPALWTVGVLAAALLVAVAALTVGTLSAPKPRGAPVPPPPTAAHSAVPEPGNIAGSWAPARGSEVAVRIVELDGARGRTVVARTAVLAGRLEVAGTRLTAGDLRIDLSGLGEPVAADGGPPGTGAAGTSAADGARTSAAEPDPAAARALLAELRRQRSADFAIAEATELPDVAARGSADVNLPGEVTINGLAARMSADSLVVRSRGALFITGSAEVAWADYDIPVPLGEGAGRGGERPLVQPKGRLDFSLRLERA